MRQNRKRGALRFGAVIKLLLLCLWLAGIGLGYVWQKNQIYRLGDEIKQREALLVSMEKRGTMLAAQLAYLKSPAQLESRCQEYRLGLFPPRESQVVLVYEPDPAWEIQFRQANGYSAQPRHWKRKVAMKQ